MRPLRRRRSVLDASELGRGPAGVGASAPAPPANGGTAPRTVVTSRSPYTYRTPWWDAPAVTGVNGWTVLAAIIAGGASLMAVILGIEQLTSGARLRNFEAMLRAAGSHTDDDRQRAVLASLHTTTVARLVARDAVPGRKFVLPSLMLLMSVALGAVTWIYGRGQSDFMTYVVVSATGGVLFGGRGIALGVNLARERARVARCYLRSVTPIRAVVDLDTAWTSGGTSLTWRSFAMGFFLMVAVGSGVVVYSNVRVLEAVPFVLLGVALSAMAGIGNWFRKYITDDATDEPQSERNRSKSSWSHPTLPDGDHTQEPEANAEAPR